MRTGDPPSAYGASNVALLLVLGQIASLQLGAVVATGLIAQIGGAATAALRISFAALIIALLVRPRLGELRRENTPLIALFGAVLAAMNVCFFEAIHRIPLGVATTLEFLGPLAVVLLTAHRRIDMLWGALAGVGVALLTWTGGGLDPSGVLLALAAAACRALYILCSKAIGRRHADNKGLCFALLFGALLALPPSAVLTGSELLEPAVLGTGLAVAALSSAIPYALDMAALRRLPAHAFGVLISLAPAAGALAGYLLLEQRLRPAQVAGVALVVAASMGAMRSLRSAATKP